MSAEAKKQLFWIGSGGLPASKYSLKLADVYESVN